MALAVKDIYDEVLASFNRATGGERTEKVFLRAVNKTLDELSRLGEDTLAHIDATDGSVTGLAESYSDILSAGVTYHMMAMGLAHQAGPAYFDRAAALWSDAKGDYMMSLSKDDQADEDDDEIPENDIVGLGYLGDE